MNPLSRGLYQGFCFAFMSCILSEPEGKLSAFSSEERFCRHILVRYPEFIDSQGPQAKNPGLRKIPLFCLQACLRTTALSRKCQELEVKGHKEPKQPETYDWLRNCDLQAIRGALDTLTSFPLLGWKLCPVIASMHHRLTVYSWLRWKLSASL